MKSATVTQIEARAKLQCALEQLEFWTSRDLAAYLNLAEITLRAWRSRGVGPRYIKTSCSASAGILYSREDVKKWCESRKLRNTSDEGAVA